MTGVSQRQARPQRRRRPISRILLSAALLAVVFALGVAFGQATEENPAPDTAVTSTRVIVPVATVRETVTVTTTVADP